MIHPQNEVNNLPVKCVCLDVVQISLMLYRRQTFVLLLKSEKKKLLLKKEIH